MKGALRQVLSWPGAERLRMKLQDVSGLAVDRKSQGGVRFPSPEKSDVNKQSRGEGPPRVTGSGGKVPEEERVGMLWEEEEVSQGEAKRGGGDV